MTVKEIEDMLREKNGWNDEDLCPVCGADLETWEELLHEKHVCYMKVGRLDKK